MNLPKITHYESEIDAVDGMNDMFKSDKAFNRALTDLHGREAQGLAEYNDDECVGEVTSMESLDRTLGNVMRDSLRTGKKLSILIFGCNYESKIENVNIMEVKQVLELRDGCLGYIHKEDGMTVEDIQRYIRTNWRKVGDAKKTLFKQLKVFSGGLARMSIRRRKASV